jgi:hypothetical protein
MKNAMKNKLTINEKAEFYKAKKLLIQSLDCFAQNLISEKLNKILSSNDVFLESDWRNRFREKVIGHTYDYLDRRIRKIEKLKKI